MIRLGGKALQKRAGNACYWVDHGGNQISRRRRM